MRAIAALLVLAVPLLAAPVPKALAKRPPSLTGTWEVVEWYDDQIKMELGDGIVWTIDGEKLSAADKRGGVPVGYAHNATRTIRRQEGQPNAVEYSIIYSDGSSPDHRPAVIELDGDTLKLNLAMTTNVRPTECKPTNGTRLYVLKRTDPK